jgi:hypothetical protein
MYYFPVLQRSPAFYCNFIYNKDLVQMDGKLMWLKITDPLRVNLLRGRLMGLPGAQVQEGWYHARSNYSTKKQKQNGPLLSVPNWTLSCSATTNEVCYLHLNGSTDQIYSIPPQ